MRRLNKKQLTALTLTLSASVFGVGYAAEADMEEYIGEEYLVTATKTKLEAKEIPAAAEVINSEDIKEMGAYSVQDALRLRANIDVQDNGITGNQVMLRGNSTMHTLILVDGKRLAQENTSASQNAYALKRLNIADIERIEVIRSNSSAIYGSDAIGGVINIITKKADKPGFSINMHTGTKEEEAGLLYSSGRDGRVSVKLGGSIEKIRKNDTGRYRSIAEIYEGLAPLVSSASSSNMHGTRRFLNTGLTYSFDERHDLEFNMNFMREQLRSSAYNSIGMDATVKGTMLPTAAGLALTQMGISPSSPGYAPMYAAMVARLRPVLGDLALELYPMRQLHFYDNNRSDFSLAYNGRDGKHDYMLRAYFSELRKENTSYYKNLAEGTQRFVNYAQNNYKQFVVEGKDIYSIDAHNTLSFGAEYKKSIMEGTYLKHIGNNRKLLVSHGKIYPVSEVSAETGAFYVQNEIKLGEKLLLIPAVRIDNHSKFGAYVSPKIGATYKLSDNARIKANWGKGFRAPTLYELYSQMERTGMAPMPVHVIGNPDLQPEKSLNLDIGVEAEKGKLNAKLSYFRNEIKNMIDVGDYDPDKLKQNIIWTQYINRDRVEISGIEAEIGYAFNKHWGLRGIYNYLDAKDVETDKRLSYRSRHNGLLQLSYTDAKINPWTINLYSRFYVDYHQSNEPKHRKDYTFSTTGLLVDKQISNKCHVYAGVENIFNKSFYYDTYNTYSVDGRSWRLGAEWSF